MNRIRLIIHRLFRRPIVAAPARIYARRIPTGVMLDLEHPLARTLTAIADDEDLLALLLDYAADRAAAAAAGHDGHAPERLLLEQIIGAVGYQYPVYGQQVAMLADRLHALAPVVSPAVAAQRREGGAAA